jgi:hypothetical protein
MINSTAEINHPGELKIQVEVVSDSQQYAQELENIANELGQSPLVTSSVIYENGTLKAVFSVQTPEHARVEMEKIAQAELPAPVAFGSEPVVDQSAEPPAAEAVVTPAAEPLPAEAPAESQNPDALQVVTLEPPKEEKQPETAIPEGNGTVQ